MMYLNGSPIIEFSFRQNAPPKIAVEKVEFDYQNHFGGKYTEIYVKYRDGTVDMYPVPPLTVEHVVFTGNVFGIEITGGGNEHTIDNFCITSAM